MMNEGSISMPSYEELRNEFVGFRFRHFKGNIYLVTDIAVHTETGEPMVIYKDENDSSKVWCRPLEMFTSEVDHDKYPDAKQKMRFEKINENLNQTLDENTVVTQSLERFYKESDRKIINEVLEQLEPYKEEMTQFGCAGIFSDMMEVVRNIEKENCQNE